MECTKYSDVCTKYFQTLLVITAASEEERILYVLEGNVTSCEELSKKNVYKNVINNKIFKIMLIDMID